MVTKLQPFKRNYSKERHLANGNVVSPAKPVPANIVSNAVSLQNLVEWSCWLRCLNRRRCSDDLVWLIGNRRHVCKSWTIYYSVVYIIFVVVVVIIIIIISSSSSRAKQQQLEMTNMFLSHSSLWVIGADLSPLTSLPLWETPTFLVPRSSRATVESL